MIFVDESIQQQLGFICVAYVYCEEDPAEEVAEALRSSGLCPGVDEYKSGRRMEGCGQLHVLREAVGAAAMSRQLAIYLAPTSERPRLLESVVRTAATLVEVNSLERPQAVWLDEGIPGRSPPLPPWLSVQRQCDSRVVPGIQLADYVAYHCAYLLKCHLTQRNKPIQMGEQPHPLSGEIVDLDWIVRTEMRRSFFHEPRDYDSIVGDDWFFQVEGYGAFFSPELPDDLLAAARATFGSMYLGCVW